MTTRQRGPVRGVRFFASHGADAKGVRRMTTCRRLAAAGRAVRLTPRLLSAIGIVALVVFVHVGTAQSDVGADPSATGRSVVDVLPGLDIVWPLRLEFDRVQQAFRAPIDIALELSGPVEVVRARVPTEDATAPAELVGRLPIAEALESRRDGTGEHLLVRPDEWTVIRRPDEAAGLPAFVLDMEPRYLPEVVFYAPPALVGLPRLQLPQASRVESLVIALSLQTQPLPWLLDESAYGTDLLIRANSVTDQAGRVGEAVNPPVPVVVTGRGVTVDREHQEVLLRWFGVPVRVPIRVGDHRQHPFVVEVLLPWGSGSPAEVDLLPGVGRLGVSVHKPRTLGLGLESSSFSVQRFAEDGFPLATDRPLRLDIVQSGASAQFQDHVVTIAGDESSAMGIVRALGVGRLTFYVTDGEVSSEPVDIIFVLPWLVLALAMVGGAGGAMVFQHDTKPKPLAWGGVLVGAFVGVLVVAAVANGLVRLSVDVDAGVAITAIGALVIGAAAGFGGRQVLGVIAGLFGLMRRDS